MKWNKYFLNVVFAFILYTANQNLYSQQDKLKIIDSYIQNSMQDWKVPGLAITIIHKDSVIFQKCYGLRNIETNEPVDENTIFQICSMTKTFTAAAIGLLVQKGLLEWDDRVIDYLPEFRMFDPYVTRELRIRDLLCHRSGLPMYFLDPIVYNRNDYDQDEVIKRIQYAEPAYSFRSSFEYTNATFMLAGEIIKNKTGIEWQDFIIQEFFKPLKMSSSFPNLTNLANSNSENIAVPYTVHDGKIVTFPKYEFDNREAAGSINSTVNDLTNWIKLISNSGVFEKRRMLSLSVFEEMTDPQVIIRPRGFWGASYTGIDFLTYGLGWFIYDFAGEKIIEHGGGSLGFRSTICIIPDRNFGFSILSNLGKTQLPEVIRYKILEIFYGKDSIDWNAVLLDKSAAKIREQDSTENNLQKSRILKTQTSLPLTKYEGIYENPFIGKISIEINGDNLNIKFGKGQFSGGTLNHWHYDIFRISWNFNLMPPQFMTFRIDKKGNIESLEIENFGEFNHLSAQTE